MVNSILQYIEPQLKAYMQFLNRVDSPVFRISSGEMIKGNGQEKEVVTISDLNGNSLYIRQTQPETMTERKALSSCDKEYNISARCKVVFYNFGGNAYQISPDKVKTKIINALSRLDFCLFQGQTSEIKIDINGTSLDMEKIYTEETGKEFYGGTWPTLVSVDFTVSYVSTNCGVCDIEDNEKDDDGEYFYFGCAIPNGASVLIKDQNGNIVDTIPCGGIYTIEITMNGRYINETFTGNTIVLPHTPIALTEELHVDGSLWTLNEDYTISGDTITLINPITESSIINCPYKYL